MKNLWVVLLDVSGSMGESFIQDKHQADSKLNSAKGILINQIRELNDSAILVIIAFNDKAKEIFTGSPREILATERKIQSLSPGNSTDIGQALEFSSKILPRKVTDIDINIVVITDGQSDYHKAVEMAKTCAKNPKVKISTILLDADRSGYDLASAISIRGTVTEVNSHNSLQKAMMDKLVNPNHPIPLDDLFSNPQPEPRPKLTIWAEVSTILGLLIALLSFFVVGSSTPVTLPGFLMKTGVTMFAMSIVAIGVINRKFMKSRPKLFPSLIVLIIFSIILIVSSSLIYYFDPTPLILLPPWADTPTPTPTSTYTPTPTSTPTFTPTPTSTSTPTPTSTPTFTPSLTLSPTFTQTSTIIPTGHSP